MDNMNHLKPYFFLSSNFTDVNSCSSEDNTIHALTLNSNHTTNFCCFQSSAAKGHNQNSRSLYTTVYVSAKEFTFSSAFHQTFKDQSHTSMSENQGLTVVDPEQVRQDEEEIAGTVRRRAAIVELSNTCFIEEGRQRR